MKKYILSLVFVFTFVLVGSILVNPTVVKAEKTCTKDSDCPNTVGASAWCRGGICIGDLTVAVGAPGVDDLVLTNTGFHKLTWSPSGGTGTTFNLTVYEKGGTVPTFIKTGITGNTFDAPCLSIKGCEYTLSSENLFGKSPVSPRYPFIAKANPSSVKNSNLEIRSSLTEMLKRVSEDLPSAEYIEAVSSAFNGWKNSMMAKGMSGNQNKSLQTTWTSSFYIAGTALNSKMGFNGSPGCNLSTPITVANPQLCITRTLAEGSVEMMFASPIANANVVWTGACSPIGGTSYPGSRNKSCYIPPMFSNKSATATFSCNTGYTYFKLQGCRKNINVLNINTNIVKPR